MIPTSTEPKKTYSHRTPAQKRASLRNTWNRIRASCYDPTSVSYACNGGRGIRVCDRWLNSFDAFVDDMGDRTTPNHVIHRKDGDGDFTPENCCWATWTEHNRSSRNVRLTEFEGKLVPISVIAEKANTDYENVRWRIKRGSKRRIAITADTRVAERLTFQGKSLTFEEWEKETGIDMETLRLRFKKKGWSVERTLSTPITDTTLWFEYRGKRMNLDDLVKTFGIARGTLYRRLVTQGWPVEKAITTPVKRSTVGRLYQHMGERKTLAQWAKQYSVNYYTLYTRVVERHMPITDALQQPTSYGPK